MGEIVDSKTLNIRVKEMNDEIIRMKGIVTEYLVESAKSNAFVDRDIKFAGNLLNAIDDARISMDLLLEIDGVNPEQNRSLVG